MPDEPPRKKVKLDDGKFKPLFGDDRSFISKVIKQIIYSEGDFCKPSEESVQYLKLQLLEILDQFTSAKKKV